MSEYQYYEFQAIDSPLTEKEMGELRRCSTRARITPTTFVNDYSWGSFKGDKDAWMEKYFDAFLYLANWGTHVLKLRLPARRLDPATARDYCVGHCMSLRENGGNVVLSFVSDDESDGEWIEGEGHLSSLISVRAELARGDLRALYLGWLLCAQNGELDDDEEEPPVPAGLGQLSASLGRLAEFLRIDRNLLHVTAEASPTLEDAGLNPRDVSDWVGQLAAGEKDELLTNLIVRVDHTLVTELLQRFLKSRSPVGATGSAPRRTAGQLLRAAEAYAEERKRIEAEGRAREEARRRQEAAIARAKHIDGLVGRESTLWAEVNALIATKQQKSYDRSIEILTDLRDLAARKGGGDFRLRVASLRLKHVRKPSLIERLDRARL